MTPQSQLNGEKPQLEVLKLTTGLVLQMKLATGSNYLLAIELSGRNLAIQQIYQAMLCVATVNGDVQITKTKMQLEALADRLGPEGLDELADWFQKKTMPEMFEARELLAEVIVGMPQDDALKLIVEKANAIKAGKLKNLPGTQ